MLPPPYKNQGFSHIAASVLAVASVVGSANEANAATFTFSFTNVTGNVPGTVEGIIELPDGDGTFAATSLVVTSAPVEVLPPNGTDFAPGASTNSFVVVNGAIVNTSANFFNSVGLFAVDIFGPSVFFLSNNQRSVESPTDLVTFTSATTTPEPTSLLTLMGVGVLGAASKLKKKA